MAASIGLVSAGVGAYGALSGMMNSNTAPMAGSVSPAANSWAAPYMGGAASGAMGSIPGLSQYNMWPQLLPTAQGVTQNMVNNPGAPGAIAGASGAANLGMGAATGAYGMGGMLQNTGAGLINQGMSLFPGASSLMGMGFDPQNAYYNRQSQRATDATRAGLEARGINMTPYGAGIEGQAANNFNIDWQNTALQRAIAGAQGAAQLTGQGTNTVGTGANVIGAGTGMQAGAAPLFMQSAMYPYATNQTIGQNQMGALSGLGNFAGQGAGLQQQQIEDYLKYMASATGVANAATSATNSQLQGNQLGFNQAQQLWQNQQTAGGQLGNSLALAGRNWPASGWGSPSVPGAQTGWGSPSQLFPGYTGSGFG